MNGLSLGEDPNSSRKRVRLVGPETDDPPLMATADEIAWASGVGEPVAAATCKHQACRNRKKGGAFQAVPGSKYCTKHKCSRLNCPKTSQGPSKLCIGHGGGKRCETDGCNKSAQGSTKYCVMHGGGRRCEAVEGCPHSAISGSRYCTRHGEVPAREFQQQQQQQLHTAPGQSFHSDPHSILHDDLGSVSVSMLHQPEIVDQSTSCCAQACKGRKKGAHAAVRGSKYCLKHKCIRADCPKTSIGASKTCIAHGGGIRCEREGCNKAAQGASKFCILHGGGRRCITPDCRSSAISGSKYCTRHGNTGEKL